MEAETLRQNTAVRMSLASYSWAFGGCLHLFAMRREHLSGKVTPSTDVARLPSDAS